MPVVWHCDSVGDGRSVFLDRMASEFSPMVTTGPLDYLPQTANVVTVQTLALSWLATGSLSVTVYPFPTHLCTFMIHIHKALGYAHIFSSTLCAILCSV